MRQHKTGLEKSLLSAMWRMPNTSHTGLDFSRVLKTHLFHLFAPQVAHSFQNIDIFNIFNMRYNHFQFISLASILKHCPNIRQLHFSATPLKPLDWQVIVVSLSCITKLEHLYAWSTRITSSSLRFLVDVLPNLPNLKTLALEDNEICDQGIEMLVEVIPLLKKLANLSLNGNPISHTGIQMIEAASKKFGHIVFEV